MRKSERGSSLDDLRFPETRKSSISPVTAAIESAIRAIPLGSVSTYGEIARAAGLPNGARQVVRVLHSRSHASLLPWYRVLGKDRRPSFAHISLSGTGHDEQYALLRSEGIEFEPDGTVSLERFGFQAPVPPLYGDGEIQ